MTLGTVLVSAGLFALAHVRSEVAYLAVWVFLGLARRESAPSEVAPAGAATASADGPPLEGRARSLAIALFALIMSLNGFVSGVISGLIGTWASVAGNEMSIRLGRQRLVRLAMSACLVCAAPPPIRSPRPWCSSTAF